MQVPLAISVPVQDRFVNNFDLVPTILALTGKRADKPFDGRVLDVDGYRPDTAAGEAQSQADDSSGTKKGNWWSVAITIGIILSGMTITAIFKEDIFAFGQSLMERYGQTEIDVILFLLTAVSSSPLALPIWGYALVGVAMGYNVVHLAAVMALGSATGSLVTFLLGRFFGSRDWVQRKFPNLQKHPWAYGRSRLMVTMFLFLGTASPLPCDVFYAACGLKRYPTLLFWVTMVAARFVRYLYLGFGFDVFKEFL
jgi:membrane protein YqaA with SNARE-associated domain